jgi:HemX protein
MSNTILNILRFAVPALYAAVSLGYGVAFLRNQPAPFRWSKRLFIAGVVLHTLLVCCLALQQKTFPFETVYKGMFLGSWVMAILLLAGLRTLKETAFGAFLFPAIFALTSVAVIFLNQGIPLPRLMRSYYFVTHVSLLFTAYACFFLSFVISIMYLLQHHAIRSHSLGHFLYQRLPSLETMDHAVMQADALGLFLLFMGIIMGLLWLHVSAAPASVIMLKIGFTILTAIVYLSEHVLRIGKGWEGQRASALSILGFALVIGTLMVGRHGY